MQHFANTDISLYQHTLRDSITCIGRGLHTGLKTIMTLVPAEADSGIEFIRRDINNNNLVRAHWHQVSDTQLCTTVANAAGIRVSTTEHLLAALRGAGIDNVRIILDAPEIPIMDGSSKPFLDLINQVGALRQNHERRVIVIERSVSVENGEAFAEFSPSLLPWMELSIDFSNQLIGRQKLSCGFSQSNFASHVSEARTFGFEKDLQELKRRGFARGSSLDNAILLSDNKIVNVEGLRYTDEFVRHKYLDAVGDLALAGHLIIGNFKGHRSGHRLNYELVKKLMLSNAWTLKPFSEVHNMWLDFHSGEGANLLA